MSCFAAALSRHPVATQAVGEVAGAVLEQLGGDVPDLVVVFASPHFSGAVEDVADTLASVLGTRALIGGSMAGVVGGAQEVEDEPGISVWAAVLPGTEVRTLELRVEEAASTAALVGWPGDGLGADHERATLLLIADPFTFPIESVLDRLAVLHPHLQVVGGLASAARGPGGNRLILGRGTITSGAVGALLTGGSAIEALVSQGCRPLGRPFTVTDVDGRALLGLGGKRPLERLAELALALPDEERERLAAGLHLGVVVDEQQEVFRSGDFLVRNVVGARQDDGALVVAAPLELGQTVQFQVRDASAADEDLRARLAGRDASAALLFTCTGRGRRLFGDPDHDAGVIGDAFGHVPVAGAFCAGEVGPVGGRNHVHGFTASLALFRDGPGGPAPDP